MNQKSIKQKKLEIDDGFIQTHQRIEWQKLSPAERLRRSWQMRKKIKNLEKYHDKKIFPNLDSEI